MIMNYFELQCKAYIKKDFSFRDSFHIISKFISFSLAKEEKFLQEHYKNQYKTYSFSSFIECQKNKPPKHIQEGMLLCFRLRTIDKELFSLLPKLLEQNTNNPFFSVVATQQKIRQPFFISELYTLTPTVITLTDKKFWSFQNSGDVLQLQRLLHENLEKKYKQFYGDIKPMHNFIQLFEIKNKTPQFLSMQKEAKTIKLLGNKFRIIPHEDEISQKLAFLALGVGLGEKNTLGGGFLLAKGLKL